MTKLKRSESTINTLLFLYENIDKLSNISYNDTRFNDFDKITLYRNIDINVFINKDNKSLYLVFEKKYEEILPFKIKLSSGKNTFNRRVINEFKKRLFKVINTIDKDELKENIRNLYLNKISLIFKYATNAFFKSIGDFFLKRENSEMISRRLTHFYYLYGFDSKVIIKRSLLGKYTIQCYGIYYPETLLMRTFVFSVSGYGSKVKSDFIEQLRNHLL